MNRYKKLILPLILALIMISTALSFFTEGFGFFSDTKIDKVNDKTSTTLESTINEDSASEESADVLAALSILDMSAMKEIEVEYNNLQYDLKMFTDLTFDKYQKTYNLQILFIYYLNGERFEFPAEASFKPGYSIKPADLSIKAWLNPQYQKVYLNISDDGSENGNSSLYSADLTTKVFKTFFQNAGHIENSGFSHDFSFLAFTWSDSPLSSIFQEKELLMIYNCHSDESIIFGSRLKDGNFIGKLDLNDFFYDFSFLSWLSSYECKLMETAYSKSDGKMLRQAEVVYDLTADSFKDRLELLPVVTTNPEIHPETTVGVEPENTESSLPTPLLESSGKPTQTSSEAAKTLELFYKYISTPELYNNAADTLDKNFKLELTILKAFGVEWLNRDDITAEDALYYSNILKSARFDKIIGEKTYKDAPPDISETDGISQYVIINYFQHFETENGPGPQEIFTAILVQRENKWFILNINDNQK